MRSLCLSLGEDIAEARSPRIGSLRHRRERPSCQAKGRCCLWTADGSTSTGEQNGPLSLTTNSPRLLERAARLVLSSRRGRSGRAYWAR
ncbi:LAGLIDADG family homing endonuclease [Aureimonas sp. D3]|uniref:LAGLIDADG family homing endonuclease n=1 Tax=Aureimonas sp. D3 TaxID=1638164 RepID=UPI0035B54980